MKTIYSFLAALFFIAEANAQLSNFNYSGPNAKCVNENWVFTNSSLGATSYLWDFGDGQSSSDVNPTHAYSYGGDFLVKLTAYNGSNSHIRVMGIHVRKEPQASFNMSNWGDIKPNETLTLTNYSNYAYRYRWDFGDGQSSETRHAKHTYTSSGNKTLTLIAYNNCGDSDVTQRLITVLDTTSESPNANGSLSTYIACPLTPIGFYNYSDHATQVKWIFGNGQERITPAYQVEYSYLQKGKYTVALVAYNGNKTDTAYFQLLISDSTMGTEVAEGASISPQKYMENGYGYFNCPGKKFMLQGTYQSTVVKHTWKVNNITMLVKDTSISFADTGNYSLLYIVESACGSVDSAFFVLKVRNDSAFSNYPVTIYALPGSSIICPGNKILLQANYYSPDTSSLSWLMPDNSVIPGRLFITPVFANAGNYTVKLINNPECGLNDTTFTQISVSNLAQPPVDFFVSGADIGSENCVGNKVILDVANYGISEYSLNPVTHKWYMGDGTTYTTEKVAHQYAATGTFTIVHETMNSCGNTRFKMATVTMFNYITPSVQFYGMPDEICAGDSILFDNFTNDADSFVYDFGNGVKRIDTTHFPHQFYAYPNGGIYFAKLYAYNLCGVDSGVWKVIVNFKANGQILMSDTAIAPNSTLVFNRNTTGAVGHLWRLGTDTSTASAWTKTFAALGTYWVKLYTYNAKGCVTLDSVKVEVKNSIGLNENAQDVQLNVYPNPAHSELNIQIQTPAEKQIQVTLLDFSGKAISTLSRQTLSAGDHILNMLLPDIGSGFYLLRVLVDEQVHYYKIIKQ